MKGALIPLAMALVGAAAGTGAALVLAPGAPDAAPHGEAEASGHGAEEAPGGHGSGEAGSAPEPASAQGAETGSDGHGAEEASDAHGSGEAGSAPEPASSRDAETGSDGHGSAKASGGHGSGAAADDGYVKLDSQFVVPVIEDGRTISLVVLALSLEVEPGAGAREAVFAREPKLRDALLRVMFDHANAGGFSGGFTAEARIEGLRDALRESARAVLGPGLRDVLILDIARQEV